MPNYADYMAEPRCRLGDRLPWDHFGATWRIRLNDPCAAAMRPWSNDFDHLLQADPYEIIK